MQEETSKGAFGAWFDDKIEISKLKKKDIAAEAGIRDGSLSRILKGQMGAAVDTAKALINALNKLANREIADMETGLRLVAGIEPQSPNAVQEIADRLAQGVMASGYDDLEDQQLREDFLADMQTIAASMLQRKLEEQKRKRGKNN